MVRSISSFVVRPRTLLIIGALLVLSLLVMAGGRPLSATLTGAAEVPGPGDPDGSGSAHLTINPGQGEICYTIEVEGIAPAFAAHIHEAPADASGPVVVGLVPPTDGSSSACADVDRDLALEILKNPQDYYVNVHNADFPPGALRGQLSK